jgi:hypothetical protein
MYGIDMKRGSYKIDYTKVNFSEREKIFIKNEIVMLRLSYPKHIPVLIRSKSEKIKLRKYRFLAGSDLTIAQFLQGIREKMIVPLSSSESMYVFINNTIPCNTATFFELYQEYKDKDTEMLILTLCVENTFGIRN